MSFEGPISSISKCSTGSEERAISHIYVALFELSALSYDFISVQRGRIFNFSLWLHKRLLHNYKA